MTAVNIFGFLVGMGIGGAGIAISVGITTSRWWHHRQHRKQRYIFSCDHCLKEWRDSPTVNYDEAYYCQHKGCSESFDSTRDLVAHAITHAEKAADQKTLSIDTSREKPTMMGKLFGRKAK